MDGQPTGWGGQPVQMPTLAEIREAAEFLGRWPSQAVVPAVVRSPLIPLRENERILLKPESLQPIGSYKLRGVLYWASKLSEVERQKGFNTHSAGNTAQAIGVAAKHYQVAARSLLPDRTPASKIELIRNSGVVPHTMPMSELLEYVFSGEWQRGEFSYLNPWADQAMVAGNATIGLEIVEDLSTVKEVYVPVGGGGLMAGVGSTIRHLAPDARVIAVQPAACPALAASLDAGKPTWVESHPTICDTSLPLVVDELYPLLEQVVDDVVLVNDDDVRAAMRELFESNRLVTEAAGAMSLAAAAKSSADGTVVCILSGASIGTDEFFELIG